jgi:hypothetical protein
VGAGEVNQEIGHAYVQVFGGCLERAIRPFVRHGDVYTSPHKLTFPGPNGKEFSFDIHGGFHYDEVFIESKGYTTGANLLDAYKAFVAKAYATTTQFARHGSDHFWFVSNVPFGCQQGRNLVSTPFLIDALKSEPARSILGDAPIDQEHVRRLSERVAAMILTDRFIRSVGVAYLVRPGDTLWAILKSFHGGRVPGSFGTIAAQIAAENNLSSPDVIKAGKKIVMPWYGILLE